MIRERPTGIPFTGPPGSRRLPEPREPGWVAPFAVGVIVTAFIAWLFGKEAPAAGLLGMVVGGLVVLAVKELGKKS